jgi:hypothetical protein
MVVGNTVDLGTAKGIISCLCFVSFGLSFHESNYNLARPPAAAATMTTVLARSIITTYRNYGSVVF